MKQSVSKVNWLISHLAKKNQASWPSSATLFEAKPMR